MTVDITPENVARYDLEQPDSHMGSASMREDSLGDWVRFDDYAALAARLAEVEAEIGEYVDLLSLYRAENAKLREALDAIVHFDRGYAPELRAIARAALQEKP
jgi:hypothetical protein